MVKIRYSELPAGLHVSAAADREGTVVYLQPGLTPAQRRAALTRVRSSARMGQGPMLPRPAMARAIAADRMRTSSRIGTAAARRHPMLFLPPVILLVVSAMAFVFMSIQPLTAVTRGNVAAGAQTLPFGAAPLASSPARVSPQQAGHHRRHHTAAAGVTGPGQAVAGLPASCAASRPPTSRLISPTSPSRPGSALAVRCLKHPRWAPIRRI